MSRLPFQVYGVGGGFPGVALGRAGGGERRGTASLRASGRVETGADAQQIKFPEFAIP